MVRPNNDALADAYVELESDICDMLRAADLACQFAFDESDEIDELVFFTARECQRRAKELKEKYYHLWPDC